MEAAQQSEIEREVAAQAVVGEEEPPSVLLPVYADNPAFLPKLHALCAQFRALRRSRGDGNCFYRSLLVSLAERLVRAGVARAGSSSSGSSSGGGGGGGAGAWQALYDRLMLASPAGCARLLSAHGYPECTLTGFSEAFSEWLESLSAPGATAASALDFFRDADTSWWSIYWLRMLTSLELQEKPDEYLPFIFGTTEFADVKAFAGAEVEKAAVDADQVQIIACCRALGVRVRIAYLDASAGDMQILTLPSEDGDEPVVAELLYRVRAAAEGLARARAPCDETQPPPPASPPPSPLDSPATLTSSTPTSRRRRSRHLSPLCRSAHSVFCQGPTGRGRSKAANAKEG